jgi:hypothetical protein
MVPHIAVKYSILLFETDGSPFGSVEIFGEGISECLGSEMIPKGLQFGHGIEYLTQLVNLSRIRAAERMDAEKHRGKKKHFLKCPSPNK